MSALAIIPARGGSKRIPRKNLREFLGKPIIAYSIEAALASDLFDEVMVSTDDEEIASFARKSGAQVPFFRSAKNADDHATTADVLAEVIAAYAATGRQFDEACCIYPTAPFVTAALLSSTHTQFLDSGADVALPIARFGFPIWRSFRREGDRVFYNWPEYASSRSQDLPAAFQDAGQFYFFRPATLARTGQLITTNALGIEIAESDVQDIDTEEDWLAAERKFRARYPAPRVG